MSRIVGVKAYGWDWSTEHGLDMAGAARRMVDQKVDWVLAQNLVDPLPGSAVDQRPPAGAYGDREWTARLQDQGLRVYQSTACFFQPDEFADHVQLRPMDQHGMVFEPFSWYVGICPTDPKYLARKAERLGAAVSETQPDGVFLSFLRFPGFWEMWLPDAEGFTGTRREDIREYCFCERCLGLFSTWSGADLGTGSISERAGLILRDLRAQWTTWKCTVVADVALALRERVREVIPTADVIVNGFGLGHDDFGNAVEEVLGHRFAELDRAADHYELMFYFQIQKRDPLTWIPERVAEVRRETGRTILADLQAGAEYTDAIYAPGRRRQEITVKDWLDALRGVARSGADGVLVYSWRDLLADQASGGERVRRLIEYKSGDLD
ncbi:hypothetical protein [Demequina lutea]|uniref:Uncharacterized protein n=1 Tax=Demequina lutea TaxID=431489 RepID=A0A7Y9ZCH7_9MICO|nr:hypothetical protein [Demequina lutea]NYI42907.1 hypothetical protein [Demequina lutea]